MEDISKNKKRIQVWIDNDTLERMEYWAKKKNMKVSEYAYESVLYKIAHENQDYNLPSLEINRLNQLIEVIHTLNSNVENLENITRNGFNTILSLTSGESYLTESE